MKNIDLTKLFILLMESFNVSSLDITTLKQVNEKPLDILIKCYPIGINPENIDVSLVEDIVNEATNDFEFPNKKCKVNADDSISIYIEFDSKPLYDDSEL